MMLLESSRPAEPGFDAMGRSSGKPDIRVHRATVSMHVRFSRAPVPHERRNLNGRAAPHPRSRPTSRRPQTLPRLAGMNSVGRVMVWNRSLASVALRAPWITTESSFGRGAIRARPGGIDDVELPDKPLARDDAGVMTNDPRGCDGSKSSRKGSRGSIGSHLTHSTSPFESPRNRPEVGSSHVPHPRTCGPQSHWDRCTSLHIRGARGAQRWSSHRSTPLRGCTSSRYINVSFGTAHRERFLDAC